MYLNKNRLEAMTDAIFAFAMTLLVLNIEVPETAAPGANPVFDLLSRLAPDFTHYLIAFLVLAGFWVTHHYYYEHVERVDRKSLWMGIFAMLVIVLVPFTADIADTFIDFPVSAMLLDLNVIAIGGLFLLQWRHSLKAGLVSQAVMPEDVSRHYKSIIAMPLVAAVALCFALAGFTWSIAIYVFTPIVFWLLTKS
jgi:uncharacterized membrane protein